MKKLGVPNLTILLAIIFTTLRVYANEQTSWFDQRALGDPDRPYLYYPDEKPQSSVSKQVPQTGAQAQAALEQLQESVKLSRALALMNPTESNLKDYVQKQEKVMNISSVFADQWRRVLWKNPELDYSQTHRPTNATAIRAYDQVQQSTREQMITQFAQYYGLVFFVRSDCQYCHAFAPILKQFQEKYNVRIMTVTMDGAGVPGFDNALPDNGIATKLGVEVTPALYVADTYNRQYVPLSFGVLSGTELEERVVTLMTPVGKPF